MSPDKTTHSSLTDPGVAQPPPLRLAHFMMYVANLEESIAFYEAVLRFAVTARHRYEGHALAYLRSPGSDVELELIQPDIPNSDLTESPATWHLGFVVDDLAREFARFAAIGVRLDPIEDYVANGVLQTRYFYAYDLDGHQIEILEGRGRYARAGTSETA
jgi:catechol 2,3-dioxygenase-like lactoylglutathione lyase family enzyme